MIFATVGTQLPFPRFLAVLEQVSTEYSMLRNEEMVVQSCDTDIQSGNFTSYAMLSPERFDHFFQTADIVVGHAGIGTIITARKLSKPLIIFPRRASLGEHRNDHQMATARLVKNMPGIYVAENAEELIALLKRDDLLPAQETESAEREQLRDRVRQFIAES